MFRLTMGVAVAATLLSAAPAVAAGGSDDTTPPQITITGPSGLKNGWGPEPYNVTVAVSDSGGSGMSGFDWELTGASTATGTHLGGGAISVPIGGSGMSTLSVHATDKAGNEANSAADFGVDSTPPWITLGSDLSSVDKNTVVMGTEVHADYTCGDSDSGVGLCTSDVPQGGLLDTSEVGPHSLVLTAQDNVLRFSFYTLNWEVVKGTFSLVSPITYDRTPNVGETITALPPKFTPAPESISYQWLRNGQPISGATSRTYTTVTEDSNADLAVQATPHKYGYNDDVFTAGAVKVSNHNVAFDGTVDITGLARVGRSLTVQTNGNFQPSNATVTYRWYRGSFANPIAGAEKATYTPTAADAGKVLMVRTYAEAQGYGTWVAERSTNVIARTTSTLSVSAKALGKRRVRFTATARATGVVPTGTIRVRRNGAIVGTAHRLANGTVRFQISRQPRARVTYVLEYSGNAGVTGSTATVRVRVS